MRIWGRFRRARRPVRFLKALSDATVGYEGDAKLLTAFPTAYHQGAASQLSLRTTRPQQCPLDHTASAAASRRGGRPRATAVPCTGPAT
jgi:hypothetical protein